VEFVTQKLEFVCAASIASEPGVRCRALLQDSVSAAALVSAAHLVCAIATLVSGVRLATLSALVED